MAAFEVLHAMRMKELSGGTPFGMDTTRWPCRWYDAVRAAGLEDFRVEEARDKVRELNRSVS